VAEIETETNKSTSTWYRQNVCFRLCSIYAVTYYLLASYSVSTS